MRADPDEYLSKKPERSRFPMVELLLGVVLLVGILIFWWQGEEPKPPALETLGPPTVTPISPLELPPTPDIPQRPAPASADVTEELDAGSRGDTTPPTAPVPLSLEQGNDLLRRNLVSAGVDTSLSKLLDREHPLEMSAALIDGLGRGLIIRKMMPLSPPTEAFSVTREDDIVYMNTASYTRYDGLADTVISLDSGILIDTFHTLRPLYENAFEQLGLPGNDFDNAIIRTLDLILATPEIEEPIPVRQKSVVYAFADPALEQLPALQKQLLRMGPSNIRRIKIQARTLRDELLAR